MPKAVMKAMKAKPLFPAPKRGKHRVQRRPASKNYVPVPYVRHGTLSAKNKGFRQRWGESIQHLMSLKGRRLITHLQKDKILPSWQGRQCPRCAKGVLGTLNYVKAKKIWAYRCNHKRCHKFLQPHDYRPVFFMSAGNSSTSLGKQAAALYCATANVPCQSTHLILDMDHKPVERVYTNLDVARAQYVVQQEKKITYGGNWEDVEVDEVDLGKLTDESLGPRNTKWEQWGGLVQRGCPSSLCLFRLNPKLTTKRAPGPGPIKKVDWAVIAKKHLANRKVVLHSDGARAYTLKIPQVKHCNVVHKKKKVTVNGKAQWFKPHYTKVYTIKLPDRRRLKVKSGTQVIDRSQQLVRKIRSAQFTYWNRNSNMWKATGRMIHSLFQIN
ncbi:unnamed protein product [Symbiodinium natans]|uniref:Uncharacterized protein n=1 Tax=Symbiodinium natans TaxID=878477 RepID=A0A812RCY7_9DINO|nr:unnamed protein product [Symbiodinium natans]